MTTIADAQAEALWHPRAHSACKSRVAIPGAICSRAPRPQDSSGPRTFVEPPLLPFGADSAGGSRIGTAFPGRLSREIHRPVRVLANAPELNEPTTACSAIQSGSLEFKASLERHSEPSAATSCGWIPPGRVVTR